MLLSKTLDRQQAPPGHRTASPFRTAGVVLVVCVLAWLGCARSNVDGWTPKIAANLSAALTRHYPPQKWHEVRRPHRLRVLHYIDYETHSSLMDRWFARSHASFLARTDLVEEAVLWGPGFPNWNQTLSLEENIKHVYGSASHFHALLPYYNIDQTNSLHIDPAPLWASLTNLSQQDVLIIDRPHEMRQNRRVEMLKFSNTSLLLCPYANECDDYAPYYGKQSLIVHQPHPVDADVFFRSVNSERENDVVLAGNLEPEHYPLRHRLAQLIAQGKLSGENRKHPDYPDVFTKEKKLSLFVFSAFVIGLIGQGHQRSINGEASLRLQSVVGAFQDLHRHFLKVSVCFAGVFTFDANFRLNLQKYGEAAASGCLIAGSIPSERQQEFRSFVVPLSMSMTDEEIQSTLKYWLEHDEERKKRASIGQDYFLRHFTQETYAEQVIAWIHLARQGQRGTIFPFQWTRPVWPLAIDG